VHPVQLGIQEVVMVQDSNSFWEVVVEEDLVSVWALELEMVPDFAHLLHPFGPEEAVNDS